ncbi:sugar phosphate nucleotidyltransferase, partial [Vibrio sp. D406a]|uniref:sugar phosphate nucleotidyltransferase n=1 Tax=Vibrio sp. D406a TaxID=2836435 RepID=UPI002555667D
RSKPSVPFGGSYRLIDFALNNFVNADLMRIYVLTQFKSQSLFHHMKKGWNINGITDRFIDPIPAQMRTGKRWYEGTADEDVPPALQNVSVKSLDLALLQAGAGMKGEFENRLKNL